MDENDKKLLNSAVGAVIRGERVKRGLTRQELADISGIKVETIKSIETGKYKISTVDMAATADAFGLPVTILVRDIMAFFEDERRKAAMSAGSTTSSTNDKTDDPREMDAGELDNLRQSDVALAAHPNDPESEQDEQYQ